MISPFLQAVCTVIRKHLTDGSTEGIIIFDDLVTALAVHTAACMSRDDRARLMARVADMYPLAVEALLVSRKSEPGLAWDVEDTGRPA